MAMLTAYLDESRTDGSHPLPVVAGYLSEVGQWLEFGADWNSILDSEGITVFHAADCWANEEDSPFADKANWTLQKKDHLVNRLLDVIERHALRSIITALDNSAYLSVIGDRTKSTNKHGSPYELCGFSTAVLVGMFAEQQSPFPVAFVFDEGNRYRHQFEQGYAVVRRGPFSFAPYLGPVAFASDARVKPLQAADLIAWTLARTAHEDFIENRSKPSVPWADRVWNGVPRLENYMQRKTLEGIRDLGFWDKPWPSNRQHSRFLRAFKPASELFHLRRPR